MLCVQGFNIPPELQEEEAKSGDKFEDIESGGLGEGEGMNDVSNKLESEDQLDEALKEGENKESGSDDKELKVSALVCIYLIYAYNEKWVLPVIQMNFFVETSLFTTYNRHGLTG